MVKTKTKLYKNWKAICKLGEEDRIMMQLFAGLDLENPTQRTERVVAAFPEFFSQEPQGGPFPLSYIRRLGTEMQDPGGNGAENPYSYGVHTKLNIPCVLLAYDERRLAEYPELLELRPSNIGIGVSQGTIVEYALYKMVVFENNDSCREIALVPAELVDVNA